MSREDKLPRLIAESCADPLDQSIVEINFRFRLDEVVGREVELLRDSPSRQPTPKELRRLARRIYEARQLREKVLDGKLFGEPAWDMLLALYHLPALGEMLTVSGLCCCSGVPASTALRWQTILRDEGLIERGPHENDRRMQFVRLTPQGKRLLEQYLTRLHSFLA
jgi:DNA-binding MarR family transcriptional regulator